MSAWLAIGYKLNGKYYIQEDSHEAVCSDTLICASETSTMNMKWLMWPSKMKSNGPSRTQSMLCDSAESDNYISYQEDRIEEDKDD